MGTVCGLVGLVGAVWGLNEDQWELFEGLLGLEED